MNNFRLIVDDIALPSHVDHAAAEAFYRRAVDAVTDQLRALDVTPGYFRWMKTMEQLGEDIAASFDKPALQAAGTPHPPLAHDQRGENSQEPRAHANSGGFKPEERL